MYQKLLDVITGQVVDHCIRRLEDGAIIPADPANTDYRNYMEWRKEGNEAADPDPLPVEDPTPA